jgi:glycosyltransferase involved in cell wall biosynthesis
VIIIFLNVEKFIQEAIQSVLSQTFSNWELLMVDDGSTDASTDIVRMISQQHPNKIRYLAHPGHQNLGMSASRNLGIRNSAGEFIAFLDADDAWFPYTLQEQVAILECQSQAAMVYGPILWWYSWTGLPEDQERDYIEKLGVPSNTLRRPLTLLPLFLCDKAAVPSGILVRRQVINRVGGFEDAFRGEYEDQVFCAKICLHESVFASSHCWYRYRQHPDSSVSIGQTTGQTYVYRLAFLNWLEKYLQDQKIKDPRVWWPLKYELSRFRHPGLFRLSKNTQNLVWRLDTGVKRVLDRFDANQASKQRHAELQKIADTEQND